MVETLYSENKNTIILAGESRLQNHHVKRLRDNNHVFVSVEYRNADIFFDEHFILCCKTSNFLHAVL